MIKDLVYLWNRYFNLKIIKHYRLSSTRFIFIWNDNTEIGVIWFDYGCIDYKTKQPVSPKIQAKIENYLKKVI